MTHAPSFENDGPEIVFGLVGAIGTPLDEVEQALKDALREVGYSYDVIRVIELLHEIDRWKDLPHANEEERYRRHIDAGREFCEHVGLEDALARLAIGRIKKLRSDGSGAGTSPRSRHAYILRSLKRPTEVALLREVYDAGFVLIAASSPRESMVASYMPRWVQSPMRRAEGSPSRGARSTRALFLAMNAQGISLPLAYSASSIFRPTPRAWSVSCSLRRSPWIT